MRKLLLDNIRELVYLWVFAPSLVLSAMVIGVLEDRIILATLLCTPMPWIIVAISMWMDEYGGAKYLSKWLHPVLFLRIDGRKFNTSTWELE